jgi:hypothetical protein
MHLRPEFVAIALEVGILLLPIVLALGRLRYPDRDSGAEGLLLVKVRTVSASCLPGGTRYMVCPRRPEFGLNFSLCLLDSAFQR